MSSILSIANTEDTQVERLRFLGSQELEQGPIKIYFICLLTFEKLESQARWVKTFHTGLTDARSPWNPVTPEKLSSEL